MMTSLLLLLLRFVSEKMGGAMTSQELDSTDWCAQISQLKQSVNCNVLPLGFIKTGFFCHRALLFKVSACTLQLFVLTVVGTSNRCEPYKPSLKSTYTVGLVTSEYCCMKFCTTLQKTTY